MFSCMPNSEIGNVVLCEKCHFPLYGTFHDDRCEEKQKMLESKNDNFTGRADDIR